jgi:hypothetical protein
MHLPGFILVSKKAIERMQHQIEAAKQDRATVSLTTLENYQDNLIKCARCQTSGLLCGYCVVLHQIADQARQLGIEPPEAL